jgi:mono/diheme cytochrome c family protein
MLSRWPIAALVLAGCCVVGPGARVARAAEELPPAKQLEFFEKSVRPILATHCLECHDAQKKKGGLRLDSRAAMMTGGDTGVVVVPHKPDESRLIAALSHKELVKMPPKTKLKEEEIDALVKWVKMGAPWPEVAATVRPPVLEKTFKVTAKDREFWSFQPVAQPALPQVQNQAGARTPVDQFVLAKLEANHLQPVEAADKRTLIRRAYFDLIGLPPTPEEIDTFLRDESPNAFAKVVDSLLASPHYGERWGRHWLDIARYGEDQAHTFQARLYPNGFRYRDWVVKAFNDDMAYDRFIKEQIAADLLDEPDRLERLPALGFFALGPVYYGDGKKLDQYDDRIDTLTRGMLGLTVACARCHDHKFDPIGTKDYYALAGIIASTDYEETPLVSKEEVEAAIKKLTEDEKKKKVPPKYPFTHALKEGKPANLRVHVRGNPATLGEEAPRSFISVLVPDNAPPFTKGSGRLELAEAIASKSNPLTARVMVNRIWKQHFGRGIVRTASNFGQLGERPTHPELLDYLASRFMASDWSIKAMHREIMLSATYQLSSRYDAHSAEIDGDNKLLWRMNRRRLEVEPWRDSMLAVSGTLDPTLGGPSTNLVSPDNNRRTLYGSVSRHELNPLLRLFDFPDPNVTCEERTVTTVPLQQLFVLNSEFMVRNAKALTALLAKAKNDDAERIRAAFLLLYGRPATERDVKLGLAFLAAKSAGQSNPALTRWEQYAQVLLSANEFLYVD